MRYSKLVTKKLYICVASVLVISTLYFIRKSSSVLPLPLSPASSIVEISSEKDLQANHEEFNVPHTESKGSEAVVGSGDLQIGDLLNTGQQHSLGEGPLLTENIQEAQLQHQEEAEHILDEEGEKEAELQNGGAEQKGTDNTEQEFSLNEEAEKSENDQAKSKVSKHVRYIPESILANLQQSTDTAQIDWSKFAYVQYATREDYVCNVLINFARLRSDFKTKATFVLIATNEAYLHLGETMKNELEKLDVIVKVVKKLQFKSADVTWIDGFTKFYAFGLEEYNKIIYLDSDATILGNMDELFFIPDEVDIAMPLAYDETAHRMKQKLAEYDSVEESEKEIPRCSRKTDEERKEFEYSIVNDALMDESKYKEEGEKVSDTNEMSLEVKYHSLVYQRLPYLTNEVLFDSYYFSDHFMVIKPKEETFKELLLLCETKGDMEYDMNLINKKFSVKNVLSSLDTEMLILPHKTYGALSGTFRVQAYELLYYTDPTEVECFARKEFEREQKEKEMKEEKGPDKDDQNEANQNEDNQNDDNQNEAENGNVVESDTNQEGTSLENGVDAGPIFEHVALVPDLVNEKTEGQDSSDEIKLTTPVVVNKEPEAVYGLETKKKRRNEDTMYEIETSGAIGRVRRTDEPNVELDEQERKLSEEQTNKVWHALKLVHFSDYPIPKPWMEEDLDGYYVKDLILCPTEMEKMQVYEGRTHHPRIVNDCSASYYWNGLYETFRKERLELCGLDSSIILKMWSK